MEILRVHGELSPDISHSLLLGSEGESLSRGLLLQLRELQYTETDNSVDAGNAFAAFIDACRAAGHPVQYVLFMRPFLSFHQQLLVYSAARINRKFRLPS